MKKRNMIIIIIAAVVILAGGGALYWYFWQSSHFFTTENAQVTANMITVTPEVSGKIAQWNVKEGDDVKAGQILGRQDTGSLMTSSAVNPQALNNGADAIASKADIKSPIDGKIILSSVVNGQVVAPGMDIATVADTSNIYVKANIEETDIFRIKQGQLVDITIDAYPNKRFSGYVVNIGQATESVFSMFPTLNTSGEYSKVTQLIPVKIGIVNDENLTFLPGMNATVRIHVQ